MQDQSISPLGLRLRRVLHELRRWHTLVTRHFQSTHPEPGERFDPPLQRTVVKIIRRRRGKD